MSRRGRGEGSIMQLPDGRWLGRVDLGWRDGKRRRKSCYGRTRKAAADKMLKALRAHQQGEALPDERQTVAAFLTKWLELMRSQLRPRSWSGYEVAVRLHLLPGIGRVPLAKLTPAQLETWFVQHQAEGATPHAISYARTVLRAALGKALRWNSVSRNVATLVDAPRRTRKEIQPLMPEEARTLLAASAEHRLGGLISIATAMGLRVGEALGLRWQDIDLDAGILRVRQALERSGGDAAARRPLIIKRRELRKRIAAASPRSAERRAAWQELEALRVEWRKVRTTLNITEPKSTRSRRTIRMPAVVIAAVKSHRTRQLKERLAAGGDWQDTGLVFATPIGSPLDARNMSREYKAILKAAGLPNVRFHDLRHTAATLLLAQGVDPRTIMETLGHSQISLTLNTYSHVLPALQADAAAKLDAVLTR